ncbi:MAG TPA: amidohydrolase family protein, partial [Candidatus Saccharimonadales bacterium]|nr:amidohydrolase family protein [Candidatus Saccharimonadales bacterium]
MHALRQAPDLLIEHVRPWEPGIGFLDGDAVAIAGDRILAVDTVDALRGVADGRTRRLDGRGRVLMPGFVDSHTHFQRASIAREFFLDFEALGAASVAEIQAAVADRVAGLPTGTWIQGDALVAQRLAEGRMPHRLELDAVAPHHPVVLRGIGRHTVVVNSLALRLAGISRDDAGPPGGRIGRDADGELNGSLHERA